eukprot:CAMPEP_0170515214 /NCGR_PEP_ID=MMETSP0209-20121228/1681_1 /TAXON_ID=665100 ORGANISM="Litonotus pictus, Strain P1" /NCGR_SAMPLE_ID=MMETSP0209 /ASSEMBLY_ACC=CAM_ASM_000301 /LENGTH=53 /DNA_ID=CAMNT_0010799599 /DNA_START=1034 /DNA_END=1192 /DNA_ORIENTATION=-
MEHHYDNFHADHHYYHTKNYSIESPVDIFMKTAVNNNYNEIPGFAIKREEDQE